MQAVRCLSLLLASVLVASVASAGQTTQDAAASDHPITSTNAAAKRAYTDGKLDLGAPFDVEMKATLSKDGKIDPATVSFTRSEGDTGMTALVKNYLSAIDQGGYTKHLADIGASEIVVRARQDNSLFNATLSTELTSALRAVSVKTLASAMLSGMRAQKSRDDASEADRRDLTLLNGTTVTTSGRSVIVALELSKATFREMVEKELKK
jgi:hypothetical protein